MTKNTQIIILIVASQLSWAVCCLASVPAFAVTTYAETAMQWALMLNGIFITTASGFLLFVALMVGMRKEDPLSPKRFDPKFSFAMGATAFLLIAQVVLSAAHAAWQPDESTIEPPVPADVDVFEFYATLDDGQVTGGAWGFVIEHPADQRPIFVTVSQQFSTAYGLEYDLSNTEILEHIDSASVVPANMPDSEPIALGRAISFDADALFATGSGIEDSMSDVLFFEAPMLAQHKLPVKTFGGLVNAPDGQKLFSLDEGSVVPAKLSWDGEDVWELDVTGEALTPGAPILDWHHEVVGFVTNSDEGEADVFPMHLAYDYLGEPLSFR